MSKPGTRISLFVILVFAAPSAGAGRARPIDFETVYAGLTGSFDTSLVGDHVFRNKRSWCAFWTEAFGEVSSPPACPAVDFRHDVVLASLSQEGGCSRSQIDSITRVGRRRNVEVLVRHSFPAPGSNCVCLASFWHALQAVAVARPIRKVEFVHESVEFECQPRVFRPNSPER